MAVIQTAPRRFTKVHFYIPVIHKDPFNKFHWYTLIHKDPQRSTNTHTDPQRSIIIRIHKQLHWDPVISFTDQQHSTKIHYSLRSTNIHKESNDPQIYTKIHQATKIHKYAQWSTNHLCGVYLLARLPIEYVTHSSNKDWRRDFTIENTPHKFPSGRTRSYNFLSWE